MPESVIKQVLPDEPEISFAVETMLIESEAITLWAKFEVIPPPVDEEFISHNTLEVRLDGEDGPDITALYREFDDLTQFVDDAITTELN